MAVVDHSRLTGPVMLLLVILDLTAFLILHTALPNEHTCKIYGKTRQLHTLCTRKGESVSEWRSNENKKHNCFSFTVHARGPAYAIRAINDRHHPRGRAGYAESCNRGRHSNCP